MGPAGDAGVGGESVVGAEAGGVGGEGRVGGDAEGFVDVDEVGVGEDVESGEVACSDAVFVGDGENGFVGLDGVGYVAGGDGEVEDGSGGWEGWVEELVKDLIMEEGCGCGWDDLLS